VVSRPCRCLLYIHGTFCFHSPLDGLFPGQGVFRPPICFPAVSVVAGASVFTYAVAYSALARFLQDWMSFATHYHILHGSKWAWENLHLQHHQIRNPTAFGGVAVHPSNTRLKLTSTTISLCFVDVLTKVEGVIQLAIPANFIFWFLPINFWVHSALMLLILLGPALAGHDGSEGMGGAGPYDLSKHYYHHTTWYQRTSSSRIVVFPFGISCRA
jgi:hypothetical protein